MSLTELELSKITLTSGSCKPGATTVCLMEACSLLAQEPELTDNPMSVDPYIAVLGRSLNDLLPQAERQSLVTLIPELIKTGDEQNVMAHTAWRVRRLIEFAATTCVPIACERAGMHTSADLLWQKNLAGSVRDMVESSLGVTKTLKMIGEDGLTMMNHIVTGRVAYGAAETGEAIEVANCTRIALRHFLSANPQQYAWNELLDQAAIAAVAAIRRTIFGRPAFYKLGYQLMSELIAGSTRAEELRAPLCPACRCNRMFWTHSAETGELGWGPLCSSCEELQFSEEAMHLDAHTHPNGGGHQVVPWFRDGEHIGYTCSMVAECGYTYRSQR